MSYVDQDTTQTFSKGIKLSQRSETTTVTTNVDDYTIWMDGTFNCNVHDASTGQITFTSGNNQDIALYVAKNGSTIPESEMIVSTDGTGKASAISVQGVVSLQETDYIEIFIENNTSTTNITVEYLNTIIKSLN